MIQQKIDGSYDSEASTNSKMKQKATGKIARENKLNELTGTEWLKDSVSVWFSKGLGKDHKHAQIEKLHPAPFSYQDIMRLVKYFTKTGNYVLDPFCGVASTLKACDLSGRFGVGIELSEIWVDLGKKRLREEVGSNSHAKIIQGDARDKLRKLKAETFDYLVTSPPYWQILNKKADHKVKKERLGKGLATNYSEDPRDLANIADYKLFLKELKKCFRASFKLLKNGKYASIIVSDFRHNSTYHAYHFDVTELMEKVGFKLKGITILYQNAKNVYPYGYPYSYVPNIHHQYILNFQKPVPEKRKVERKDNAKSE